MNVPLERALARLDAERFAMDRAPAFVRAVTDTRTLVAGDTFVALHGERFDGHDFVGEAVARGAAMVVVDRPDTRPDGVPALVVADTLRAYMAIASAARELFRGPIAAITGSTGKTTTKVFLAQLLAAKYGDRVLASPANENNEIGVSKLLLASSNEAHDVLVVEMGARKFGDIAILVDAARPDLGILTNVGEAHLEIMGSRERLAQTKWGLFSRGARAVLNGDDDVCVARAPELAKTPHWFFVRDARDEAPNLSMRATTIVGTSTVVDDDTAVRRERPIDVRVPGKHNRANLAAAMAAALDLGVDLDAAASIVPNLAMPSGRYESFAISGGWRLIYDAYNANASGMIAALDAFANEPASRRIAVLSSMAELGDESQALHERVGAHAVKLADVLLVGGDYADALERGALTGGMQPQAVVRIADNADAARWLRRNARTGDVVLLKGSRKYKLEEIVRELRS